jgi:hypothetical protein
MMQQQKESLHINLRCCKWSKLTTQEDRTCIALPNCSIPKAQCSAAVHLSDWPAIVLHAAGEPAARQFG